MPTTVTREIEDDEEEKLQSSFLLLQPCSESSTPTQSSGDVFAEPAAKEKQNLHGNPDPHAEVVALSSRTVRTTNRYMCEVCHKVFQREENLQLHKKGHNFPWKLKQKSDAPAN